MSGRSNNAVINSLANKVLGGISRWQHNHMQDDVFYTYKSAFLQSLGFTSLGLCFYALGQLETMRGLVTIEKDGLIKAVKEFAHQVNSAYYQRYFDLIGSIYTVDDICDMCGVPRKRPDGAVMTENERMAAYYEKAGLPSSVVRQIQRYIDNEISMDQLTRFMHLDVPGLAAVQGNGWMIASNMKRDLQNAGITVSMDSLKCLLEAEADFLASLTEEEFEQCIEVVRYMTEKGYTTEQINQLVYETIAGDPELIGRYNPIWADASAITISGSDSHDFIMGSAEDNYIYGNEGDDIIVGSGGNDYLHGGRGSDTYIWRVGDGNDTINDTAAPGEANVLCFGEGIIAEDIVFARDGENGVFTFTHTGETITVENWFANEANQLAEIRFIDGTILTPDDLGAMAGVPESGGAPSRLSASAGLSLSGLMGSVGDPWASSSAVSLIDGGSPSQLAVDIAVAGLQFDSPVSQVCDFTGGAAISGGSYMVSPSVESVLLPQRMTIYSQPPNVWMERMKERGILS